MGYLRNRIESFKHAFRGLLFFLRDEPHARLHFLAVILVTILGFYLNISRMDWIMLVLTFVVVISVEMLNSALEKWIDHIHPEKHDRIKWVKDVAAGAVLVVSLGALVIGLLIFWPYFCG